MTIEIDRVDSLTTAARQRQISGAAEQSCVDGTTISMIFEGVGCLIASAHQWYRSAKKKFRRHPDIDRI